ncbi:MAG: glycosyl hydrolase family 28-related protein [Bacillota bacterium]
MGKLSKEGKKYIILFLIIQNCILFTLYLKGNDQQQNEIHSEMTSVKDFGAKGNGKNDDTRSVQKAIDRVSKSGGGTVLLPIGNYKITKTLYVPERVILLGEGHSDESTKITYTGDGFAIVTSGTHLRIQFHNLLIRLNGDNSGVRIGDVGDNLNRDAGILPRQITMTNVTIAGLGKNQYGIRLMNASHINMTGVRSGYGTGGTGLSIWNDRYNSGVMTFNDCTFGRVDQTNVGLEIDGSTEVGLDSFVFNGCYFGGKTPIRLGKTVTVRNINFTGIHVEGKGRKPKTNLIEIYNAAAVNFNGVSLGAFGSFTTQGFVFKEKSEKINILGVEVNDFKNTAVYKNEGGYDLNDSIMQEALLTGITKKVKQFSGDFEHVTRITGDKLITKNIQAKYIFSTNGSNKLDWGTNSPEKDASAVSWTKGDQRINTNPVEFGENGSKYVIEGWKCISSGTPGKWVEMRALTGN